MIAYFLLYLHQTIITTEIFITPTSPRAWRWTRRTRQFQRQYEQYKLERDNIDFLKKELHDLKRYLLAMQSETDPDVFHQYFSEIRQYFSYKILHRQ